MKFTRTIFMMALLSVAQSMKTSECVILRKEAVAFEVTFESERKDKEAFKNLKQEEK